MKSQEIQWTGGTFRRVVRSQRTFKGVQVGAIHDKGYLVIVYLATDSQWAIGGTIRKLK